jgi:hypothetical protein
MELAHYPEALKGLEVAGKLLKALTSIVSVGNKQSGNAIGPARHELMEEGILSRPALPTMSWLAALQYYKAQIMFLTDSHELGVRLLYSSLESMNSNTGSTTTSHTSNIIRDKLSLYAELIEAILNESAMASPFDWKRMIDDILVIISVESSRNSVKNAF